MTESQSPASVPLHSKAVDKNSLFLKHFVQNENDLRAFISSVVRDFHTANDIFQEVSIILWNTFDRYEPTKSFGAWARAIAHHKIQHHWRQVARTKIVLSNEALDSLLMTPPN
jgi:RNA polymerase sigma-70 factor, ECF subfamily